MLAGGLAAVTTACVPFEDALLDGVELEQAASCSELEQDMRQRSLDRIEMAALMAVTGGRVSAGFGNDVSGEFSETNNQESGVDEADLMKVDSRFVYAVHHDHLVIVEAEAAAEDRDVENFRVSGAKLVAELPIDGQPFDLHLEGDRIVILARTDRQEIKELFRGDAPNRPDTMGATKAILVDITDRANPRMMRELILEGDYISSRRIKDNVFLVMRAELRGNQDPNEDPSSENFLDRRRSQVNNARIGGWLPSYYDVRYARNGNIASRSVERCSCRNTFTSEKGAGDSTLTIYTMDLEKGDSQVSNTTVVGDGGTVYGSLDSLVIALNGYGRAQADEPQRVFNDDGTTTTAASEGPVTFLHRFALRGDTVRYNASGVVEGWTLNQFSLSEHDGFLRVATQIGERSAPDTHSAVFTMKVTSKTDELFNVGGTQPDYLKVQGRLDGIAPGEDMYAIRFMGDRAYMVTFIQTDPLWNINLKDPTRPRIDGELHVPGFSTYLHPIAGRRLLAIGRGDNRNAVKLSLFDINRDDPRVITEKEVGRNGADSEAISDHRAFRYIPEYDVLAVPMTLTRANGLQLYKVDQGFKHLGLVEHDAMRTTGDVTVRRAYRVGRNLFAISGVGLSVTDLETLETVAEVDLTDE